MVLKFLMTVLIAAMIFGTTGQIGLSYESPLLFGANLKIAVGEYAEIYRIAKAIAKCEGYGKRGTIPTRLNNPGNLKAGSPADNQGHTRYKTSISGWNALHHLLMNRYKGMTPLEMNRAGYAIDPNWYKCVNFYLNS